MAARGYFNLTFRNCFLWYLNHHQRGYLNLLNSTEKMLHPVFITIDHNRVNTIGGKLDVSSWKGVWETLDLEIIIACISYPFKYRHLVII